MKRRADEQSGSTDVVNAACQRPSCSHHPPGTPGEMAENDCGQMGSHAQWGRRDGKLISPVTCCSCSDDTWFFTWGDTSYSKSPESLSALSSCCPYVSNWPLHCAVEAFLSLQREGMPSSFLMKTMGRKSSPLRPRPTSFLAGENIQSQAGSHFASLPRQCQDTHISFTKTSHCQQPSDQDCGSHRSCFGGLNNFCGCSGKSLMTKFRPGQVPEALGSPLRFFCFLSGSARPLHSAPSPLAKWSQGCLPSR